MTMIAAMLFSIFTLTRVRPSEPPVSPIYPQSGFSVTANPLDQAWALIVSTDTPNKVPKEIVLWRLRGNEKWPIRIQATQAVQVSYSINTPDLAEGDVIMLQHYEGLTQDLVIFDAGGKIVWWQQIR